MLARVQTPLLTRKGLPGEPEEEHSRKLLLMASSSAVFLKIIFATHTKEVLRAASEEIKHLRKAYEQDPDPAEDDNVIEEPANDWPAAT